MNKNFLLSLQVSVKEQLEINNHLLSAVVETPKAFCKYDKDQPKNLTSYYVVPYSPQECNILHLN